MSRKMRYWIGFSSTIFLSGLFGYLTTYIMDPGTIRLLTSFVMGVIIGVVGYELTIRWANEVEDSL